MRQGISEELIERILGKPEWTIAGLEEKFPVRNLPEGAMVTRFAPSPTGFMHIGGLYQMLINYKMAKQSGGVFMLRIEDTDTKREVGGAIELILDTAYKFGLMPDERPVFDQKQDMKIVDLPGSKYGPYLQSQRKDIYHSVVAELLAGGAAYPCFLTQAEMEEIRDKQKSSGLPTGIYGEWAKYRDFTEEQILEKMKDLGDDFKPSIRLYSTGNPDQKIFCKDGARGSIGFPENNEDVVLIKSGDDLPTYHFAHLCDDHFMRTTHVVRGEEWLSSLPLHFQLFKMMGWTPPVYVHTSTLDKIDSETGKQRKLSKRHDTEASVSNFLEDGWPTDAVLEYLLNIVSSGYEEDKAKDKSVNLWNYPVKIKKIPMSGALFDMQKLEWWAKEYIGKMNIDDLTAYVIVWGNRYNLEWEKIIKGKEDYLKAMLSIERDNPKRIRKDFITWKQTLSEIEYFWDDLYILNKEFEYNKNVLDAFVRGFDINDSKDTWWNKIIEIANLQDVKNGDVAMNLRAAITGRTNTPDLYSVMQVMGQARVVKRIQQVIG
ncbi:MAG: glutamate--tRNA ligase [Alphaproteobacteria bacterium]|nr:glutamate--tRNA ligase [Alphaproteobacteria bacterium]MBN2675565.1 glutamate--tRNA ligase [Alphaproteobacteria bacterium]